MSIIVKWGLVILTFFISLGLASVVAWVWEQRANPINNQNIASVSLESFNLEELIKIAEQNIETIDVETLKKMIDKNENFILLDVRTNEEIRETGVIAAPKVLKLERGFLEFKINQLIPEKDTIIVIASNTGHRSLLSARLLKQLGYSKVKNFIGIDNWKKQEYPMK